MKKIKAKTRIKIKGSLFLIVIFFLTFLSLNLNLFLIEGKFLDNDTLSKDDIDKLKISATYSDIVINDIPGSFTNWIWARNQPWCTQGSGSSSDPYIIENHTFNSSESSGTCLTILNSRKNFIIRNCIIKDSAGDSFGIFLVNTTEGVISNNNIYNTGIGIYLYNSSKINVNGNTVYDNLMIGILAYISNYDNIISGNTVHNNSNYGIWIWNSNFNDISGNTVYNHTASDIVLESTYNNTISGNTVYDSKVFGIRIINNCQNNTISGNTIYNNSQYGIYLDESDFNNISENIVYNHTLNNILLVHSDNNALTRNTVYDSKQNGILVGESSHNSLSENIISDNIENGIFLDSSLYNSLSENIISDNIENGILLDASVYNTMSENLIFDNLLHGISLIGASSSEDNNITKNEIYHNNESGIFLDDWVWHNTVWDNDIYDNTMHGIYLYDTGYGEYYGNLIHDNKEFGIYCTSDAAANLFYENVFVRNKKHVVDDGFNNNNLWNNTDIGNYWDNHTGPDDNSDGIVDIQYNITGLADSIDYLPIAEDGAPTITIVSPNDGDVFNESAPDFTITATDDYLYSMWYTIDGRPTEYPFCCFSRTIDQSAWDALSNGNVTLTFYADDLPGNIGSDEVVIEKDSQAPIITINSPADEEVFGKTPPSFNITVIEPNLDTIWYTVDSNFTIIDSTLIWTINQTIWSAFPEGSVTITVFANDTLGHISSEEVTITKNIPSVIGLNPFTTSVLIFLISGVAIIGIITRIHRKKRIIS